MPASGVRSSISNTLASSRPASRIRSSSWGVLTISGGLERGSADLRLGELAADDLVEGQGGIRLGEHADLHPVLGLGVDRAAHHRAGAAGLLVEVVGDFHDAHGCSGRGEFTERIWFVYWGGARGVGLQAPPLQGRRGLDAKCQRGSAAASRALASTSSSEPLAIQLPPTQSTGSNASHSGALARLMPPVGQNFAW